MRNGILVRFIWVSVVTLFLVGCDNRVENVVQEEAAPQAELDLIVALGDSLTAGLGVELEDAYPALLERRLKSDNLSYRVVNAGVSGETTSGTLSRLDWILSQNPDIVILEIGANDGLRGIDTQLVEKNLDTILSTMKSKGVVTVFTGMKMVWNLGEDYTRQFNAIYPKLAEKYGVIFMPFFLQDVAAVSELNRSDGIHPNEEGYKKITENIYPYVQEAIKRHQARSRG